MFLLLPSDEPNPQRTFKHSPYELMVVEREPQKWETTALFAALLSATAAAATSVVSFVVCRVQVQFLSFLLGGLFLNHIFHDKHSSTSPCSFFTRSWIFSNFQHISIFPPHRLNWMDGGLFPLLLTTIHKDGGGDSRCCCCFCWVTDSSWALATDWG